MTQLTPDAIIERHQRFPEATKDLIHSHAYMQYRKAIEDLEKYGDVMRMKNEDFVLICISKANYDLLKSGYACPSKHGNY